MSLIQNGFDKLVLLDGHGSNCGILDLLIEEIHPETKALIYHLRAWDLATVPKPDGVPDYDGYGDSSETAVMRVLTPEDVDEDEFIVSTSSSQTLVARKSSPHKVIVRWLWDGSRLQSLPSAYYLVAAG